MSNATTPANNAIRRTITLAAYPGLRGFNPDWPTTVSSWSRW